MAQTSRYFFRSKGDRIILDVYRLVEDDLLRRIQELVWKQGRWEHFDNHLIKKIIDLDIDLYEVSSDDVRCYVEGADLADYEFSDGEKEI